MEKNPTCRINSYITNLYSFLCRGIFAEQKDCMVCLMPINQIYLLLTLITITMVPIFKMFKIDPKIDPKKLALKIVREIVTAYINKILLFVFRRHITNLSTALLYMYLPLQCVLYIVYSVQCAVCVFCTVCSGSVVCNFHFSCLDHLAVVSKYPTHQHLYASNIK